MLILGLFYAIGMLAIIAIGIHDYRHDPKSLPGGGLLFRHEDREP